MRIALVAGPWIPVPPPAYGGTEAVVDRLARGFAAARLEVLLFTTGDSTCPVRRAWVRDRAAPQQIGQSFVELHHLLHVYDQVGDFDVVHDHTVIGPIYAQGRTRGPIVTTNHGPFGGEMNDSYRRMARHAAVVAISHDQASRSSVPISVIHHGLDPERFPVGAGEGECVLFLGRFSPDKGVKEAVLAAREAAVRSCWLRRCASRPRSTTSTPRWSRCWAATSGRSTGSPDSGCCSPPQPCSTRSTGRSRSVSSRSRLSRVARTSSRRGGGGTRDRRRRSHRLPLRRPRAPRRGAAGPGRGRPEACRMAVETHFSMQRMVRDHLDLYERLLAG